MNVKGLLYVDCGAAQGGTSALKADAAAADDDDDNSSPASSSSSSYAYVLLSVVCAVNTVAMVTIACWVCRLRRRMRDSDVISVSSEVSSEVSVHAHS